VRAVVVFLFIGLFCWLQTGRLFEYRARVAQHKKWVKAEIKNNLDPNLITSLDFTLKEYKELNWVEPQEFVIGESKYDFISASFEKGKVKVRCLNDTKEKEMVQFYKSTHPEPSSKGGVLSIWTEWPIFTEELISFQFSLIHSKSRADFPFYSQNWNQEFEFQMEIPPEIS
jgi:hypothetical protein